MIQMLLRGTKLARGSIWTLDFGGTNVLNAVFQTELPGDIITLGARNFTRNFNDPERWSHGNLFLTHASAYFRRVGDFLGVRICNVCMSYFHICYDIGHNPLLTNLRTQSLPARKRPTPKVF